MGEPSMTPTETSWLCVPLTFVCPLVGQQNNQKQASKSRGGNEDPSLQSKKLITVAGGGACPPEEEGKERLWRPQVRTLSLVQACHTQILWLPLFSRTGREKNKNYLK